MFLQLAALQSTTQATNQLFAVCADNDVDAADIGVLQACMTGPDLSQADSACLRARLDTDEDVDQIDFGIFQLCLSGDNVPGDPA